MNLSFQKLFFAIATIFALFAILVLAKPILIPLSLALLISFILLPLVKKLESWKIPRTLAAFLSIFAVILMVVGVLLFFATQIIEIVRDFDHFKDKILFAFADVTVYLKNHISFVDKLGRNELFEQLKGFLTDVSGALVSKTVSTTATFVAGLVSTIIFTFLILIYRDGLTKAFLAFSSENNREKAFKMFKSVQQVGQKYLFGMLILTGVIGLANSIGLMIIGIDNPFFFGI